MTDSRRLVGRRAIVAGDVLNTKVIESMSVSIRPFRTTRCSHSLLLMMRPMTLTTFP